MRELDPLEAELLQSKRIRHAEFVAKSYAEFAKPTSPDTTKEPRGGSAEVGPTS